MSIMTILDTRSYKDGMMLKWIEYMNRHTDSHSIEVVESPVFYENLRCSLE